MRASLAFDYIGKLIIVLIVIAVITGVLLTFSEDLQRALGLFWEEPSDITTEVIEVASFSTTQVGNYIKTCWSKTGIDYKTDVVCYILKGDVSAVDPTILDTTPGINVDTTTFNPAEDVTLIKFVDVGNVIVVES